MALRALSEGGEANVTFIAGIPRLGHEGAELPLRVGKLLVVLVRERQRALAGQKRLERASSSRSCLDTLFDPQGQLEQVEIGP